MTGRTEKRNTELGKRCSRCKQWKPLSEFNVQSAENKFRRQPYCRQCQHEYARENYSPCGRSVSEIEQVSREKREAYNILYLRYRDYRMTLENYVSRFGGEGLEDRMSFEFSLGL